MAKTAHDAKGRFTSGQSVNLALPAGYGFGRGPHKATVTGKGEAKDHYHVKMKKGQRLHLHKRFLSKDK